MSQRKKATAGLQSACARSLLACPAWNGRDLVRSRSRSHPAPAGRPRRRGPGGSGGGPSHGRRAQGLAVVPSAPTRTPPATHGRSPQHAGSLLSPPGPAAPGTGCSRSAALPRLTYRLCGEPRPALQTAAEVPLVLAQGHVAPRETASPGPAAGMEPLARVSSPVPSKTPNWNCKIVCAYLPPACLPLCCLPLPNAI